MYRYIKRNEFELLEMALSENIKATKICIEFKKVDGGPNSGCLGFPASILLLCIADAIGSHFRGKKNYKIKIDGEDKLIKNLSQHFYILNSDFYDLNLSGEIINDIYQSYRNIVVHNSMLPKNYFLDIGQDTDLPVLIGRDDKGKNYPVKINLKPFLIKSESAVNKFIKTLKLYQTKANEVKKPRIIVEIEHKEKTLKDGLPISSESCSGIAGYSVTVTEINDKKGNKNTDEYPNKGHPYPKFKLKRNDRLLKRKKVPKNQY
jgi:hypothetical protein